MNIPRNSSTGDPKDILGFNVSKHPQPALVDTELTCTNLARLRAAPPSFRSGIVRSVKRMRKREKAAGNRHARVVREKHTVW